MIGRSVGDNVGFLVSWYRQCGILRTAEWSSVRDERRGKMLEDSNLAGSQDQLAFTFSPVAPDWDSQHETMN
jgi:hypothetical protein